MSTIANLIVRLTADTGKFGSNFEKAFRFVSKEAELADKQFEQMFRRAESAAKQAEAAAAAQVRQRQQLIDGTTQAGAALSAGITLPLMATAAAAIASQTKLESLKMGLESTSGSTEAFKAKLAELQEVAKLPGLGFAEAIQGQVRLQEAGLSADVATQALAAFGNAIAVVGGGKAELDGVAKALSQIAAKGKITAEEITQLAERVPQIRKAMSAAFGTADTEALQKMGIGAEEFVAKVSAELAKIPPVTGGLKNSFENLGDSSQRALAAIGAALAPAIEAAVPLIERLVGWIEQAAEWFATLPAPVQGFALAIAGIAVAIGPVLLAAGSLITAVTTIGAAVAPIAGVLGVSVGALAGWAAAIAAAVAALAALGVWVYQNWEPIKATLMQAWEGISEYWDFYWRSVQNQLTEIWNFFAPAFNLIFGPLVNALGTVWDAISTHWGSVWEGISGFLSSLWSGIVTVAWKAWDAVVGAISDAIDWMRKNVPGMEKILTLDKAWDGAKKLEAAQKALANEVKKTAGQADNAKPKFAGFAGVLSNTALKSKDAERDQKALEKQLALTKAEVEKTKEELEKLATAMTQQKELNDFAAAAQNLTDTLITQQTEMANVANIAIPDVVGELVTGLPKITAFGDEFEIVADTADTQLTNITGSLKGWGTDAGNAATKFKTDFVDKVTDGFTSIMSSSINDLLTGEFSFAKLGNAAKQLGLDVVNLFTKPLTDAITGPNGVIQSALTPLSNKLGDIASQLLNLGSASVPAVGGSGGGGGTSSGGGGFGGGSDPVSAVTGIITAVSSVWSNFQNLEIESGIDLIEENTRWLKRGLVELPDSLLNEFKKFALAFGSSGVVPYYLMEMDGSLNAIENYMGLLWSYSNGFFTNAQKYLLDISSDVKTQFNATKPILEAIRDKAAGNVTINLTVNANGTTVTTSQTVSLNNQVAFNFT